MVFLNTFPILANRKTARTHMKNQNMAKKDFTFDLKEVIKQEEVYLKKHRKANGLKATRPQAYNDLSPKDRLSHKWGICISGGGIRSATMGLGAIQKFMRDSVFRYYDYMSTVSGGGYIASCVSSLLSYPNDPNVKNADLKTQEGETVTLGVDRNDAPFLTRSKLEKDQSDFTPKHQLYHLLTHGEYLTRNRSLFSLDIKRFVSAVLGGAISNIFLFLLLTLMTVSGLLVLFQILGGEAIFDYKVQVEAASTWFLSFKQLMGFDQRSFYIDWAFLSFVIGLQFTALYYWFSVSYILDNLDPLNERSSIKSFGQGFARLKRHLPKWYKMNEAQKRASLVSDGYQLWNYGLFRLYLLLSPRNRQGDALSLDEVDANENRQDFLVKRVVDNFAFWTFWVSAVSIALMVFYQRWIEGDQRSIRLLFSLPVFFSLGSLTFLFLLGMTRVSTTKYVRVIRSAYTGLYGGAFNTVVAALVIPFILIGIFFFDWTGYSINSPTSLVAPAVTYLITAQSGLFQTKGIQQTIERNFPKLRQTVFNLSILIFLFIIFQLIAQHIVEMPYPLDETIRESFLQDRTSIFLGAYSAIFMTISFLFSSNRSWRFILLYIFMAGGLISLLVLLNNYLDNFLMGQLPLLTILSVAAISIAVAYVFTLKNWRIYNTIIALILVSIFVFSFLNNAALLKYYLRPLVHLNLTPATFFIGSLLLILFLGFFFIQRYRSTVLNFYQDRLTEAFLTTDGLTARTKNVTQSGMPKKTLRDHEKLLLEDLGENNFKAPYHILVGALNLRSKFTYLRKDLKSEHFIFSKYYIGSQTTGYLKTAKYRDDDGKLTLAKAMTISAAAVNSAMGASGFFAQTFLITLFNLRLGKWLKNPLRYHFSENQKKADKAQRVNGLSNLWDEYTGNFSTQKTHINVSDGAHTGDNLGILPLLKRRCSTVVVCDFEADPNFTFESFNTALRIAYLEEGIWIHIDLEQLIPADKNSPKTERSVAVGNIYYPDEARGKIIYIKSSLSGDLATNVRGYHQKYPDFPHQSTSDQYFDSAQYEAYRSLGYDLAEMAIDVIKLRRSVEIDSIIEPQDYLNYINSQAMLENEVSMNGVKQITFENLEEWQAEGKAFELVDVRSEKEHRTFNIGGKHIPLEQIIKRKNELDYSKPIIFYCRKGIRSQVAIQRLAMVIKNADFYNLNAGILYLMGKYDAPDEEE